MHFDVGASESNSNIPSRSLSLLIAFSAHLFLFLLFTTPEVASRKTEKQPQRSSSLLFVQIFPHKRVRVSAPKFIPNTNEISSKPTELIRPDVPALERPVLTDGFSSAPVPAPPVNAATIIQQAKLDIGRIDKELRGKVPIVAAERPDSLQAKLERGISDAYVGDSSSVVDHYTSPDGVIYTRITNGTHSRCYMSGTVNFVPGILHDASSAKQVNCPQANSGWAK